MEIGVLFSQSCIILIVIAIVLIVAMIWLYIKAMKWIAIIILIILVIVAGSAFFAPIEDYGYTHKYEVIIRPSTDAEFELILPISLDPDDDPHYLMDQLETEGEFSDLEIVNTTYGKGLRIVGKGDMKIEAYTRDTETIYFTGSYDYPDKGHLSMLDLSDSENDIDYHWAYVNSSDDSSIEISIFLDTNNWYSGGSLINLFEGHREYDPTIIIDLEMNGNGWQLLEGTVY